MSYPPPNDEIDKAIDILVVVFKVLFVAFVVGAMAYLSTR